MRLLNVHTLQFCEYDHTSAPRYAIASHRWTRGAEASLKDVQKRRNTEQSGYKKVLGFADYVKAHLPDVSWLWIDTCCIDDRHSQEVSEAINSMFKWYAGAEICLAYLPDVPTDDLDTFGRSEWFTRGWTLQELLAPKVVLFLTKEWKIIGHKGQDATRGIPSVLDIGPPLESTIASVTMIPEQILHSYENGRHIGVEEKLTWAANRETTREEDRWYCLFGILDVAIGANYGEGGDKAKRRLLKEFSQLNDSPDLALAQKKLPSASLCSEEFKRLGLKEENSEQAQQRILESFYFPQMDDRQENIHVAHQGTYQWALLSTTTTNTKWDNLVVWLSETQPSSRIYWINAKPGAGKSSLVRLLDQQLQPDQHMEPWAEECRVLRLKYYFWAPGNPLQKSLPGLLRCFLHQLCSKLPELIPLCMLSDKWKLANTSRASISWTKFELRHCWRNLVSLVPPSVRILILIDGLDENDGDEDAQDELMDFIQELARHPQVKLCVSSRRWTVFQDSFATCPQLRLEDLNARDIKAYVEEQLTSQPRFQQMLTYDRDALSLVYEVITKADGVFLWIRLVIKDLIRGIRDGDSLHILQHKVNGIPGDLGQYFGQLMDSIELNHRWEASAFLQIALYEEHGFITLQPLRLIDMVFVEHGMIDFALSEDLDRVFASLQGAETLVYQLDTTLRRLSSRCKGLIDCQFRPERGFVPGFDDIISTSRTITSLPKTVAPLLHRNRDHAFDFQIDFMHRSLRDFLREPGPQRFLHQYTDGPFDVRNYLRNARLVQLSMNIGTSLSPKCTVGLASYFICSLSISTFRETTKCALFAERFCPVIDYVNSRLELVPSYWYIFDSLYFWEAEQSNFLTLAIDFALIGYIMQAQIPELIQSKPGRPMLDYILRPRFAGGSEELYVGNQYPNPQLVEHFLSLGADPMQLFNDTPIWTSFLSSVRDHDLVYARSETAATGCLLSLEAMIRAGASTFVTRSHLSAPAVHGWDTYGAASDLAQRKNLKRWPSWVSENPTGDEAGEEVAVVDLLECLRPRFGDRIGALKDLLLQRTSAVAGA